MGRGRGDLEFNVAEKEKKKASFTQSVSGDYRALFSCIFWIFATPGPHISPDNGSLATLCVLSGRG